MAGDLPAETTPNLIRLVFFDVEGRRDLAKRAAAAAPNVRFRHRRTWTGDPGKPRRGLLGGEPPVGMWLWPGTREELAAQAGQVLLRFVHPLLSRGLPYCIGFPFGPDVFAPRPLGFADTAALDLEDIGRLLDSRPGASPGAPAGPLIAPSAVLGRSPVTPSAAVVQPPLDPAQRAAVEHVQGPARVLAPAGAGKTKTLIARVVHLIEGGVDPSRILMLAFNRKAAEQLEERLASQGIATTRRLGSPDDELETSTGRHGGRLPAGRPGDLPPAGVHVATFNAFGHRYQRQVLRARILLDHNGSELRVLMKRAVEAGGVSLGELRPARGSDPLGAFTAALTRVRAALELPGSIEVALESTGPEPLVTVPFGPVHTQFVRAQQVTGRQSFDDQIYFAVADMLADPLHRAFIQRRFDHVLVDEFQDLNGAQLALVDLLSRPGRGLFVVGDDDQLIYGWRQADPRGILEFHQRMPPKPWSATYTLQTNYRCSRAVVESSARLVGNNKVREPKNVRPRQDADQGALRFAGAPSWPERATVMCDFLRSERERLGCEWRDMAVLCRYRSQQFAAALSLDQRGIPRTPTLGCRLFTHPAARVLRTYLDLVLVPGTVTPEDLAYIVNRPNRYATKALVDAVAAAKRPWALVRARAAKEAAAVKVGGLGPRPCSLLVERIDALAAADLPTAPELVQAIIDDLELVEHFRLELEARKAAGPDPDAGGPFQVLEALYLLAQMYPEPAAYLAEWDHLHADEEAHTDTADDSLDGEEAEDRVVIGTIHAAKGREYDAVVIPDYDCDVSRWEPAQVEEERRVVYVGVTRARDSVLFTVDTESVWVQPFLRELVETPDAGEHAVLKAWLDEETDEDLRRRIAARVNEIDVLFPEMTEPSTPPE